MDKHCSNCNKVFSKHCKFSRLQWVKAKYCSRKCSGFVNGKKLIGTRHSDEHKRKSSESLKKVIHTPEWNQKVSQSNKGKKLKPSTIAKMVSSRKGKHLSDSHKLSLSKSLKGRIFSEETRRKISESNKGSRSHLWRGGVSPINKTIRKSIDFKLWREAVFKRDDYTCVFCLKRGCEIHPDHIKPFALFPDLRFAIDNGRTLCKPCHMKTPTWGRRLNLKTYEKV